jgi:tetratricopeptide (TPR) repeat protein
VDADDLPAVVAQAEDYYAREQYEEALAAFDQSLILNPQDADVWHNKALALRALGRTAEALETEQLAQALDS